MANIRKSFNFRNGVQVDNDNFVVDANGLVGIGTSTPTEVIDAIGNAKISGLTTTSTLGVGETANFFGDLKAGSINIDPVSGIVTATKFVGDASGLTNIVAISTTGFIAQGVGIHTFKSVGIGTTNPEYHLQVGENPASGVGVGITDGGIVVSGVITATTFIGSLTGNITGSVTGVAASTTKLETARDFSINGDVEASTISFDGTDNVSFASTLSSSFSANTSGIITASKFVGPTESAESAIVTGIIVDAYITNADVGIGTFDDLRIDKSAAASLVVTSTTNSSVSIGESVGAGNSSAQLLYTPGTGRLDINNYDVGGVSINLHEGTGTGTTEGFVVKYDNDNQFEVTYDGKVGVNKGASTLEANLDVGGTVKITEYVSIAGVLTINQGGPNEVTLGDGSALPMPDSQNFNTVIGISTFNNLDIANNLSIGASITANTTAYFGGKVGIGTTNDSAFKAGPTLLIGHAEGSIWANQGFYTAGKIVLTDKTDGSVYVDNRVIPNDFSPVVPFVDYGDFQIKSGAGSLITENLLVVPSVGEVVAGVGTTNGALIPTSFLANGSKYLSKVGINIYAARSLFDVGTASTTMNSYFIPPSLNQTDINLVQDLHKTPTALGYEQSRKVTPDGIVPGAIIHNQSTNTIQVGLTSDTFRNLSPIVAFGTIVSGAVPTPADGYNLEAPANSTNDANFSFSTALQSANYTVIVSNTGTSTFTVPEVNKTTAGFKITFSSSASTKSYSVMILQV